MTTFIKDEYICKIEKDISETVEQHTERGLFIVSNKPKNTDEFNECLKYSRIYINHKYNKCTYSPTIMTKLEEMSSIFQN